MKKMLILFILVVLLIVGCNGQTEMNKNDDGIIDLESEEVKDVSEDELLYYNFSDYESSIYSTYFHGKRVLEPSGMETKETTGGKEVIGRQIDGGSEYLPPAEALYYDFDGHDVDLAFYFLKGTEIGGIALLEDSFIELKYNKEKTSLTTLKAEDKDGHALELPLTEDQWKEVAERYMMFIESIN